MGVGDGLVAGFIHVFTVMLFLAPDLTPLGRPVDGFVLGVVQPPAQGMAIYRTRQWWCLNLIASPSLDSPPFGKGVDYPFLETTLLILLLSLLDLVKVSLRKFTKTISCSQI